MEHSNWRYLMYMDLKCFQILLNLALQYTANEMYTEALNAYQIILKNKKMINSGRLKVNIGNIYYKQGNYNKAIKFYRMALDKVPNTHKEMRWVGLVCFVLLKAFCIFSSVDTMTRQYKSLPTGKGVKKSLNLYGFCPSTANPSLSGRLHLLQLVNYDCQIRW